MPKRTMHLILLLYPLLFDYGHLRFHLLRSCSLLVHYRNRYTPMDLLLFLLFELHYYCYRMMMIWMLPILGTSDIPKFDPAISNADDTPTHNANSIYDLRDKLEYNIINLVLVIIIFRRTTFIIIINHNNSF